jgi:xylan 1,4-beta-xylosidase
MLGKMAGGERLAVRVSESESTALSGAIAARKGDALYVLLYNHRAQRAPSVPETIRLKVEDSRMKKGAIWLLDEWRIDRDHGVYVHAFNEDCRKAGLSHLPDTGRFEGNIGLRWGPEGTRILKKNFKKYAELSALPQSGTKERIEVQNGGVEMTIDLPGHSVRLLKLEP